MQDDALIAEFTHQAETFNRSAPGRAPETLAALVDLVPQAPGQRWLEAACGPGIVSRAVAGRVGSVHGVDLTPAMVEVARREAAAAGVENATFAVGDATALDVADASFDGAVARFTVHHVALPGRLFAELARVVRPGGLVVLVDHVSDEDAEAAAWCQEVERLRDPSHWAALTPARLRTLGERSGLVLEHEELVPYALDFEDWRERGSGGAAARGLIEQALAERPATAESFRVSERDRRRVLELRLWRARWRRG